MTMPALLFAAGRGTRMAPLTDTQPKSLIEVAGKPLFDHAFDFVAEAACSPIVVNTHHFAEMMHAHLRGRAIRFSDETDYLRETGGGLRHARPLLSDGPIVTMNTDAVWQGPNPVQLLLDHWKPDMQCLLLLIARNNVHGHLGPGDFDCDENGRLRRGKEMIYSGAQIIRADLASEVPDEVFSMNVIWNRLIAENQLHGVTYPGNWCDVGQPESIPIAEAMLNV
ncbi:nucleotidyltransferase family protein [Yoonia litorea]|uniref:MurNAc alpha-1-phosphate uridylyltransferase n=1 Tax=Yoonia litorea TaxID=1123755 RepID=A0A1I6MVT4_9RHOB|nr:nucleotidyltransferase family protein [Yoonia litorea]SFS19833.1 MurNAc alpha-1-phosphate uridylyltransferase [Yoonia litorea]